MFIIYSFVLIDRMRDLLINDHMEEVDWTKQIEARMFEVVSNSDLKTRPYAEMLRELGGQELEQKLKHNKDESKSSSVDYLVEQLVQTYPCKLRGKYCNRVIFKTSTPFHRPKLPGTQLFI
jgi:hypothetical protein